MAHVPIVYEDIVLECEDTRCRMPFTWSANQQRIYQARDWDPPRFCASCRAERQRAREARLRTQDAPQHARGTGQATGHPR